MNENFKTLKIITSLSLLYIVPSKLMDGMQNASNLY